MKSTNILITAIHYRKSLKKSLFWWGRKEFSNLSTPHLIGQCGFASSSDPNQLIDNPSQSYLLVSLGVSRIQLKTIKKITEHKPLQSRKVIHNIIADILTSTRRLHKTRGTCSHWGMGQRRAIARHPPSNSTRRWGNNRLKWLHINIHRNYHLAFTCFGWQIDAIYLRHEHQLEEIVLP